MPACSRSPDASPALAAALYRGTHYRLGSTSRYGHFTFCPRCTERYLCEQSRGLPNAVRTGKSEHLFRVRAGSRQSTPANVACATCHAPFRQILLSIAPNGPFFCKLGLRCAKQPHGVSNRAGPCTSGMGAESWIPKAAGSPSPCWLLPGTAPSSHVLASLLLPSRAMAWQTSPVCL